MVAGNFLRRQRERGLSDQLFLERQAAGVELIQPEFLTALVHIQEEVLAVCLGFGVRRLRELFFHHVGEVLTVAVVRMGFGPFGQ